MKHAIETLERERAQLKAHIEKLKKATKPKGWRDSEWAMHVGSLKTKEAQCFEAIQVLSKVGKD